MLQVFARWIRRIYSNGLEEIGNAFVWYRQRIRAVSGNAFVQYRTERADSFPQPRKTATKVFEKLTTIRRPWSYDMDRRESRTR